MMKPNIHYTIFPKDPIAHIFEITLEIAHPDPSGQILMLPVWIPGSYMIREFARHIVQIQAIDQMGQAVAIQKINKHTWQLAPVNGKVSVCYQVYAWDDSVRAACLDSERAFFNHTCLCLAVMGQTDRPCQVSLLKPEGQIYKDWQLSTALRPMQGTPLHAFGEYYAENYDELVDHPVTLGLFQRETFDVLGVPHDIVISGKVLHLDKARLVQDIKTICQAQIEFFEPEQKKAPMDRYVFMVHAMANAYGGLEHRASTALVCKKDDLPSVHQSEKTAGYIQFLGLCSHEYFHTWNVKRIKPAEFVQYDFAQENYTALLWLFEGFTSYYDDLFLVRTQLISEATYLDLLSRVITSVMQGSGRLKQTLAESSFDAWIKYYRQDENATNAIVSYYQKGALCALVLDLKIRYETQQRYSLDDVMRVLWQRFGRDFYQHKQPEGVTESKFLKIIQEVTGLQLDSFLYQAVHSTKDLPLAELLKTVGVCFESDHSAHASLNVSVKNQQGNVVLAAVRDDGAAYQAGLSAGDCLVAIDGLKVTDQNFQKLLARYQPGVQVRVHFFRRDELKQLDLVLARDDANVFRLAWLDQPNDARSWLLNQSS